MDISQIQKQILESDEFVLSEAQKVRYLYGLKKEMRYNQTRTETIRTESVAEHIYGMCIVANYFLPLEDPKNKLNQGDVFKLISWHDADEIETGDILGQSKTQTDRDNEVIAMKTVIENTPAHMQPEALRLMKDYELQSTPEARFVKAIDKIEVSFEIFDDNYREIFKKLHTRRQDNDKTKLPYIQDYPYILRFCQVISDEIDRLGFFVK
ncbi:HD domain-containing protein [Candidatus Kaiserbacteria bacterium]|nr:HD domain-containing protein [Candidatus Kaiserbacteria bacterium]